MFALYSFIQNVGEEPRLSYDRLIVFEEDSLLTDPPTEDRLCLSSSSSNAPTTNEYHVIIRNGTIWILACFHLFSKSRRDMCAVRVIMR